MSLPHVWHLKLRSMVPMRGSNSPPTTGLVRVSSIVSGISILATDTDFYAHHHHSVSVVVRSQVGGSPQLPSGSKMLTISSGESTLNWIPWTRRKGAEE